MDILIGIIEDSTFYISAISYKFICEVYLEQEKDLNFNKFIKNQ